MVFTQRCPVQRTRAPAHTPPLPSATSPSEVGRLAGATTCCHFDPVQCSRKPRADFLACQAYSHTLLRDTTVMSGAPLARGRGMDTAVQALPVHRYAPRLYGPDGVSVPASPTAHTLPGDVPVTWNRLAPAWPGTVTRRHVRPVPCMTSPLFPHTPTAHWSVPLSAAMP